MLLGCWLAATLALWATDPDGVGALAVAAAITGMVAGIAALTMWSVGRYGNITLTAHQLRVGRDRIPLEQLNPWSVSGLGAQVQGRLAGGAYAPVLGSGTVGVVRRDGQAVVVATKDPEALRQALENALAPFR